MFLYILIILRIFIFYCFLLLNYLIKLIINLIYLFNILDLIYVDSLLICIFISLLFYIFILFLVYLPIKYLIIPTINNSSYFILIIKFAERIWIFYFYIIISIFLLHLLSIILDCSVTLLHYSICNHFLIFFSPIINDNLFIDPIS